MLERRPEVVGGASRRSPELETTSTAVLSAPATVTFCGSGHPSRTTATALFVWAR